jgi:hypothetical protein
VAELLQHLDPLEAHCLYALWLSYTDSSTTDKHISAEDVGKKVNTLKNTTVRPARIARKLNQLYERGFVTTATIDPDSGRAGRPMRGYKIAPSDKIVKWPATAAALHYLLNHDLLPIPQEHFIEEVLAQHLHDHRNKTPLSQTDLEKHIDHCITLGYIIRINENDRVLLNVGDRTRWEVHYLLHLSTHAQRKPPQQAGSRHTTEDIDKTAT